MITWSARSPREVVREQVSDKDRAVRARRAAAAARSVREVPPERPATRAASTPTRWPRCVDARPPRRAPLRLPPGRRVGDRARGHAADVFVVQSRPVDRGSPGRGRRQRAGVRASLVMSSSALRQRGGWRSATTTSARSCGSSTSPTLRRAADRDARVLAARAKGRRRPTPVRRPAAPARGRGAVATDDWSTIDVADARHLLPRRGARRSAVRRGRRAQVEPDTTVCIIEVMKMMNSVPAGVTGHDRRGAARERRSSSSTARRCSGWRQR